tara:strand:- start:1213 stop:1803 length:591 start_codon:yes stop_codon:yes gene_type:complete
MTAFDRAWDIVKEERDYSEFGEKFAERMNQLKEGGRGLPEGTKFSDLTSTSDRMMPSKFTENPEGRKRRILPQGEPINILDLPKYEIPPSENERILARIMGTKDYDEAVDEYERAMNMLDGGHHAAAMRSARIGSGTASFDDLMEDRQQAIEDGKDLVEHLTEGRFTSGAMGRDMKIPDSLVRRTKAAGKTPKKDD